MRHLQRSGLCLLLAALHSLLLAAQPALPVNEPDTRRPALFSSLPDRIPVDEYILRNLVQAAQGDQINLRLGNDAAIRFDGPVVSRYDDNTIHSVVIRPGNYNGATLTLSSSVQSNGAVRFTGRIISFNHADAYMLVNHNNQYLFQKKKFYDLINE